MTKTIAVANQKGGVGKTTTAINLSAGLAELGRTVLLIDLDPQGNATTGLGLEKSDDDLTIYDVLLSEVPLREATKLTSFEGIEVVPATTDLSSADIDLIANEKRSFLLRDALRGPAAATSQYDYIIIDCPPSLNLLTVNAMVAAHSILVPLQSEFFALEGLSQLMKTIREVRESANPDLRIEGIVMTMHDVRNNLAQQVEADARNVLGELVYKTIVPRNVRVSEAPSFAMPVLEYDPKSKGTRAYRQLAKEFLEKQEKVTTHG
ncbi:ParA family protein [Nereida sp. MMG025]|uniref:ParA family protein n=1 Tax=Nereida sp. MMG025 TaxID=2909981 RepID=UPI001F490F19|nr:AAA family ATPase [Nereida sp. MMG025]MCF6444620.1 AAA family ATPase [Nereida sp. MMG025]